MPDVTQLLDAAAAGDLRAVDELLPLVYGELRRLAAAQMAREQPGQTLDATGLVHEAYLRLVHLAPRESRGAETVPPKESVSAPRDSRGAKYSNRRHFFAAAAEAMRRILVDRARRKQAQKRGGQQVRHDLDELEIALPEPREDLVALDEALQKLAQADPQAAELVQLRFFAGFTLLDAAEILGVSPRTAHRLWAYARAYLHRAMQD